MNTFSIVKYLQFVLLLLMITGAVSCASSRSGFSPDKKYPKEALQADYKIFRSVLEESHPSLYWFISKDSLNYYFDREYNTIPDSMTEREFRTKLTYVITKIRCGHTSLRYSPQYSHYLDTARLKMFPLTMKCWGDTMVVAGTLFPKDSAIKRGTIIHSINGYSTEKLRDTFFNYLNGDGYSLTGKYQSLSNRGNFGILYKNVFGLSDSFNIEYEDADGITRNKVMPVFDPRKDSTLRSLEAGFGNQKSSMRQMELFGSRNLQIDTSMRSGYMTLNTFARGNKLKHFFKKSFRQIGNLGLQHLVIDVRANGGGEAGNSILLTQYLADHKFKIADSLYAVKRSSHYASYIKWQPLYWVMTTIVTKKHSDGNFHFGYFERHYFKPKKKNHFDGNVYIITGGNSFSATTLFAQTLKGQRNIQIVGEETGGGAYGNTAWMIPEVKLPNTKIRFRLPKFRLVMDRSLVKGGRGVMPDIPVAPTVDDIRKGIDPKEAMVRVLIENSNKSSSAGVMGAGGNHQ
jgi:hypothetical protein